MLTEYQKQTLEQIAEKKGDNTDAILDNHLFIESAISKLHADIWLMGYLLQKSTLVGVFGIAKICKKDGERFHSMKITCEACASTDLQVEWRHKGQQLIGLSLEEVLNYYAEYLKSEPMGRRPI